MPGLLGQELLQSRRQQKHCAEVYGPKIVSQHYCRLLLKLSKNTFFMARSEGPELYICPVKNTYVLYKCNKKDEKPCLMSLLYGGGNYFW